MNIVAKSAIAAVSILLSVTGARVAMAEEKITVIAANYGWNVSNGVDATSDVAGRCNTKSTCDYLVDVFRLTDPAPFKEKAFRVQFRCGNRLPITISLNPEANGKVASLRCE